MHRLVALLTFAVAAILDGVDGYVARHYHQWSELGTVLEPLADKLLLVSGIMVLSFDHAPRLATIPLWLTGTIIGRDLLLGVGAVIIRLVVGRITVRPRITGKIATVLQMAVVLWILLKWSEHHAEWLKLISLGAGCSPARRACFTSGTARSSSARIRPARPRQSNEPRKNRLAQTVAASFPGGQNLWPKQLNSN